MVIAGFQPLSLIDYPEHPAAIVFTQGCVFRCPYCHNPELIPVTSNIHAIPEETIFASLEKHRNMIDGVVITGGEPTIQEGLTPFIERLRAMGFLVKLDTNGVHPMLVQRLIDASLIDFIAMDLKHRWEKYETVIRNGGTRTVENCKQTFKMLQEGTIAHEFRTTICPGLHEEDDIFEMASYLKPGESYALQATRLAKTLEPNLPEQLGFNLTTTGGRLRERFPELKIQVR